MSPDVEVEAEPSGRVAKKTTVIEYETPAGEAARLEAEAREQDARAGKHRHLRANVRRRRGLYLLILFLAIVTLIVALVDILVLRADKDVDRLAAGDRIIEYCVYGALLVLLVWAVLLFFSRRRPEGEVVVTEETVEERQRRELERSLMQCPDCKSIFQYGEVHFRDNKRTAFSCPVCGVYSRLPEPGTEPVKVLRPEGEFKELQYHCANCKEDIAVGTFGDTPLHLVKFRACPHCGERGFIERVGSTPPVPPPAPGSTVA